MNYCVIVNYVVVVYMIDYIRYGIIKQYHYTIFQVPTCGFKLGFKRFDFEIQVLNKC